MTGLRAAVRLNRRNGLQCRASLFSRPRTCRSCAAIMFLRYKDRRKDGQQHRYWSVVENTRVAGGRVVQRHVLYLGEINSTRN